MKIIEKIRNVADYICCCLFAKAGQYEVYHIKKEFEMRDGVKRMNAYLYAVEFEKDKPILDDELPRPLGSYGNHMEMSFTEPVYYDESHNLIYVLEHRLYGGKDGRESLSIIDRHRQCSRIEKLVLSFLACMAKDKGGDGTKLNIVKNMAQTVRYKDIMA